MDDLVARVKAVPPSVRAPTSRTWCASSRCGPTRTAATRSAQRAGGRRPAERGRLRRRRDRQRGGAPAVIAAIPTPPGAPTVLLYAHHDVQPEGDPGQWDSPPFEPTERDGRFYGRGSARRQAGIATHLAAFRAHRGSPPVGVTVFVEARESGSPSLGARCWRRTATSWPPTSSSSPTPDNWTPEVPALTVSLRGLADCVVEVQTLDHGLHSGLWGGGARRADGAGAAVGRPARRRWQRGRGRPARIQRR